MTKDSYREILYAIFLLLFMGFVLVLITIGFDNGFDYVEGLGIGTILGVMIKMLSDGWTFFFRKGGKQNANE